jgi:hypothetical protein
MNIRARSLTASLLLIPLTASWATPNEPLQIVLARMDKAATDFKAMTAAFTWKIYTQVIDDTSLESGTVTMKKVQAGEVQGLVKFEKPDVKFVGLEKRSLQILYPKTKICDIYDLGEQADQLYQFLMIGFGTSGTGLARDYDMKVLPPDSVKDAQGVPAIRLALVPKAPKAREIVKSVELWIPNQGEPYPIQEKISQPSGDYRLVIYTDIKINPMLPLDAAQLKLPHGVKTVNHGNN